MSPPAHYPPPPKGGEIPVDEASLGAPFLTPEVEKFLLDGAAAHWGGVYHMGVGRREDTSLPRSRPLDMQAAGRRPPPYMPCARCGAQLRGSARHPRAPHAPLADAAMALVLDSVALEDVADWASYDAIYLVRASVGVEGVPACASGGGACLIHAAHTGLSERATLMVCDSWPREAREWRDGLLAAPAI